MSDLTRNRYERLASFLLRCWIGGFLLLLIWLVIALFMRDLVHQLHGPLFGITRHELDLIFYCGMGLLKLLVIVFFFIPWVAVKLLLRR